MRAAVGAGDIRILQHECHVRVRRVDEHAPVRERACEHVHAAVRNGHVVGSGERDRRCVREIRRGHGRVVELLRDGGYLPQLPDELRRTAELRLENPSVSLSVLAALHDESITRSGVNHRLSKLIELAEAARSGNGISV